ncbi:MAG: bacteriohemerythrin [Terriglobia bacterium]|jgi:hemerythrin
MSNPPQPFLSFESRYLVGIDALDSQHKQMVNLLNELYGSVIAKKPRDLHLDLLTRLVNLTRTHFATEEQVLRVHSYPGYLLHKAAHEGLARNLFEFREQIARRKRELTIEYVDLMKLWLVEHFAEFDLGYARFLGRENRPMEKDSNEGRGHEPTSHPGERFSV